ncbi:MAG: 3-methyl-2-oxobutanoate hydroxymethyltransferase [Candidatus Sumerlaeota bacterium]|nr:3-methyl-2-oxobutanoate hydroxymethyltransferase [Candidatus Sumerlaeota bacterium]
MSLQHVRLASLLKKKQSGQRIVMLTAYDMPTARIADEAGVDIILVGDSLGNVILGYEDTIPVTIEDMIHHTAAAARAKSSALLVADMPFMTYHLSPEQALANAGRLVQEGGAQGVKLEGGAEIAPTVQRIVQAGIPVMGHIGLTPQSIHQLSGYCVQGRSEAERERLIAGARALDAAGAFSIVLELTPAEVGRAVSQAVACPVIGIGAGAAVDGQVLVLHDMLGLTFAPPPKFVKIYGDLRAQMTRAIQAYCEDVREARYPDAGHSYE